MGIVSELQQAALDPQRSISDLLRLAQAAASKLGLAATAQWIRMEQEGYPDGVELPTYRSVRGKLNGLNPDGRWLPVLMSSDPELAESIETRRMGQPISALEALAKGNDQRVHIGLPDFLVEQLGELTGLQTKFAVTLSVPMIAATLDAVRNLVLAWALELEQKGVTGDGFTFSIDEKRNATEAAVPGIAIHGDGNVVQVQRDTDAASQTASISPKPEKKDETKPGWLKDLSTKLIKNLPDDLIKQGLKWCLAAAGGVALTWFTMVQKGCEGGASVSPPQTGALISKP